MTIYYLYIKTHNKTGLKYLGQTIRNPYEYNGSGNYWKRHLQKYGNDVITEIIAAFDNLDDLKVAGQFWSKKWNIIESNEWANLEEENGNGGSTFRSEKTRQKLSIFRTGKIHTEETKRRMSEQRKGRIPWNKGKTGYKSKPASEERKIKISLALKGKVPWNKGKIDCFSEESIQKNRISHLGKTAWNQGIPFSVEARNKMSNSHKKLKKSRNPLTGRFI